jgi:hypothetical protein
MPLKLAVRPIGQGSFFLPLVDEFGLKIDRISVCSKGPLAFFIIVLEYEEAVSPHSPADGCFKC